MVGFALDVGVSLDPVERPDPRDVLPCRLVVTGDRVRLLRRSGGTLLDVSRRRVRATSLPRAGGPPALALMVDRTVLRVELGSRLRRRRFLRSVR